MTPRPKPNALAWLLLSVAIIGIDQLSKAWVLSSLPDLDPVSGRCIRIPVIPGFWDWCRTYNTGAAFSFLSDAGGWQLWLFTGLALAISGLMAFWLSRTPRADWRAALPYALVIGGAIGNVIDRQIHGHVVDFILWYVGDHVWPAFNIADTAIVVGAVGIAVFGLFDAKSARKAG